METLAEPFHTEARDLPISLVSTSQACCGLFLSLLMVFFFSLCVVSGAELDG